MVVKRDTYSTFLNTWKLKAFIGGWPFSAAMPPWAFARFVSVQTWCSLIFCLSWSTGMCSLFKTNSRSSCAVIPQVQLWVKSSPGPQPYSLPPLWDTSHVNRAQKGEPAVLFLPSHVQVTKRHRHLKEKAIINFAEFVSERLVLFWRFRAERPAVAFVVLIEYTALYCPQPHAA